MAQAENTGAPSTLSKSPLEVAQKMVTELKGMGPEDQLLAIRFATQALRLAVDGSGTPFAPSSAAQTTSSIPPALPPGRSTDIKTFTASKSPRTDTQFAAVVAYYYQFEAPSDGRKSEIDAETVKDAARQAGRHQVPRWDLTLTNAKNAGYIDAASRGKFKLNAVGENLVAITLPGNGGSSTGNGSRKGTAKLKGRIKKKAVKK